MEHLYNLIPLIMLAAGGVALLAFDELRINLAGLAANYLAAFLLIVQTATVGLAAAKLITGLMAAGLIYVSRHDLTPVKGSEVRASRIFKITALVLIWLAILIIAGNFLNLFPVNYETMAGALIAIISGLMVLGTSRNALKVTMGILVLYAGFDILYTPLESSILINGLLALIIMLIALVGVYISTRHESEYEE
jgi:hypothetical protein